MTFTISAKDVVDFAKAAGFAPAKYKRGMIKANRVIRAKGIEVSKNFAPHKDGPLRASITPMGELTEDFAEFGTNIVYNWQREEGGTIHGNPILVFKYKGRLVRTRSVYQRGSKYMAKTMVPLRPFALYQWGLAMDEILKGM